MKRLIGSLLGLALLAVPCTAVSGQEATTDTVPALEIVPAEPAATTEAPGDSAGPAIVPAPATVDDTTAAADDTPPAPIPAPTTDARPAGDDDAWVIEVVPNPVPVDMASQYQRAYDSIPFSRAEWLANPSYRHDSAMALVTGQPIHGRTPPNRQLEIYQDPRNYRRTFFPRLAPADLHYNYAYGRYQYRPWGWWGWYGPR